VVSVRDDTHLRWRIDDAGIPRPLFDERLNRQWLPRSLVETGGLIGARLGDIVRTELAQSNSPNHAGKGNYLLCADASVAWFTSPNVGPDHDNIWTIGKANDRLVTYTGREAPLGAKDVFLCP